MNWGSYLRRASGSAALIVAAALPVTVRGESLWERRDPQRAFLFFDVNARHKGDNITVLISLNTDVQNSDDRAMKKDSKADASMDLKSAISGDYGNSAGAASYDFATDSDRSFDGSAKFNSQRNFTTKVAATVTDVLPNGNMVIEGRQGVGVQGDERIMVISGIVRPFDVEPGNVVQSRAIANLRITYEGVGQEQAFVRQGFFSRVMNKLWPF
ncbi:MAG: flagellar basal body L-ring protein FlgH [Planctomycetaceae bacterium]